MLNLHVTNEDYLMVMKSLYDRLIDFRLIK